MGFLFVRHGETTDNAANIRSGGEADPLLTEAGEAQARAAGETIAARLEGFPGKVRLIAGPVRRTFRTASLIAGRIGLTDAAISQWEDFRERRLGEWNGQPVTEEVGRLLRQGATPPGGESEAVFSRRALAAAEQAAALARPDLRIIVVSSRGIARVLGRAGLENGGTFCWPTDRWA